MSKQVNVRGSRKNGIALCIGHFGMEDLLVVYTVWNADHGVRLKGRLKIKSESTPVHLCWAQSRKLEQASHTNEASQLDPVNNSMPIN